MNVVTNPNSTSINFYCPNHLKTNFDELVKFKRVSRTSIINFLIEKWMRDEYQKMKDDNEMNLMIRDIKLRNHKNKPFKPMNQPMDQKPDEWDPPMIPSVNDDYGDDKKWISDPSGLGRLLGLR